MPMSSAAAGGARAAAAQTATRTPATASRQELPRAILFLSQNHLS